MNCEESASGGATFGGLRVEQRGGASGVAEVSIFDPAICHTVAVLPQSWKRKEVSFAMRVQLVLCYAVLS